MKIAACEDKINCLAEDDLDRYVKGYVLCDWYDNDCNCNGYRQTRRGLNPQDNV